MLGKKSGSSYSLMAWSKNQWFWIYSEGRAVGFANGSDVQYEIKKRIKKDSKIFDLNNWKDGLVIYWDKGSFNRTKEGVVGREMRRAQF